MKRVVVVQARTTSSRLPGKVLVDLAGRPMLAQQLRRIRSCRLVDEIVLATTRNGSDDPLADLARKEGVGCVRGEENDVLARFVQAARESGADLVMRVTADCPLIDPDVADLVIAEAADNPTACDYASNVRPRTYPRGLDVEATYADVLERVHRMASSRDSREHVTVFMRSERPDLFMLRSVEDEHDNSDLRWTVDQPSDLAFVRRVYADLGLAERVAPYREVLAYVRAHPELAAINAGVETWSPR